MGRRQGGAAGRVCYCEVKRAVNNNKVSLRAVTLVVACALSIHAILQPRQNTTTTLTRDVDDGEDNNKILAYRARCCCVTLPPSESRRRFVKLGVESAADERPTDFLSILMRCTGGGGGVFTALVLV